MTMRPQRMLLTLAWMALVLTTFLSASVAFAQTANDPQSLLGEWQGTWRGRVGPDERSGQYHLTVERIDGNKAALKALRVTAKVNEERSVTGKLNGNVLTYGSVELMIDGKVMRGRSSAGRGFDIELTKTK
jgi:hypothetical protein